jgi:hypothetical protein
MEIQDLFQSPGGRLAAFAQMQVHLYRHDAGLQDYFLPLQPGTLGDSRIDCGPRPVLGRLVEGAIHGVDNMVRLAPRKRIKTDVLFCPIPYFSRQTENDLLVRTLLGLAQTDAKIVCLLPESAPCRGDLDAQLAAQGRTSQITFIDPTAPFNSIEARFRSGVARMRAASALELTNRILDPYGLNPGSEIKAGFEYAAHFVESWERLAPSLEFDTVVARCHWNTLCSAVCRTALERGKPVVTFQQGVIGHTLDVPVTATKYVAFGRSSASFLDRVNQRFFKAAGLPTPPVEYIDGGSLFDTIVPLPNQYDNQTLLIVDGQTPTGDFYGIDSQCRALIHLAEKLLAENVPLRRLIFRPHPYWSELDMEACLRLVREHSPRCELSHPAWPLEDDLRRSSAVIGVFSGVLTVASACGLPTIFLEAEHGYKTGDLACFSPHQTLLPDAALSEIRRILTDRQAYDEARTHALRNAREYYANGTNLNLNRSFFERLLRVEPAARQPQSDLR